MVYYRFSGQVATISAIGQEGTAALKAYLSTFFEEFGQTEDYQQFYHFDYQESLDPIGFIEAPITYCKLRERLNTGRTALL